MSHDHNHQPANYNRAFAIGVSLNIIFVVIEAVYGVAAGSMALIADAGHNLSDVLSLLLAWGATWLATKPATTQRTYGLRKSTIMASLINALVLLFALGAITWEAIGRIVAPQPVEAMVVIVVAGIGVLINAATAWLFVSGQQNDLNIRGAYLHMMADAGVSLGVVIAGVVVMFTGWQIIDPLISLFIVAIILVGTWSLLRESLNLAVDAVPKGVNIQGINDYFLSLAPVAQIHDLHIWAMSTTQTALTVHITTTDAAITDDFLSQIEHHLHDHFDIEHATIQIEPANAAACRLDHANCC